jgi:hypothetical protein
MDLPNLDRETSLQSKIQNGITSIAAIYENGISVVQQQHHREA